MDNKLLDEAFLKNVVKLILCFIVDDNKFYSQAFLGSISDVKDW